MAKNEHKGKRRGSGKALSPYSRKGKTPYKYSEDYNKWRAKVMRKVIDKR